MTFEVFMDILLSVVGILVLLGIAVLFSNNRKAINLRTVFGALGYRYPIFPTSIRNHLTTRC